MTDELYDGGTLPETVITAEKTLEIMGNQLLKICPRLTQDLADKLASMMTTLNAVYGITKPTQIHEFIGQMLHESAEFSRKSENMNYSAARLMQVWPSRFPNMEKAKLYANDSQKLANYVYANRMGNGNEASGDGFKNRGGGFIQATGAEMYTGYFNFKKGQGYTGTIEVLTKAVREDNFFALDISYWIFYKNKKLMDEAERNDDVAITRAINGGEIGLKDRINYTSLAKKYIL